MAKIADLPDSLFTGEMTLGSANRLGRGLSLAKNRLDGLADEQDFDLFVAGSYDGGDVTLQKVSLFPNGRLDSGFVS